MDSNPICPNCKVEMETGFTVDYTQGGVMQATWHQGEPEDRRLLGLKLGLGVQSNIHEDPKIISYRCPECHLLQNYTT